MATQRPTTPFKYGTTPTLSGMPWQLGWIPQLAHQVTWRYTSKTCGSHRVTQLPPACMTSPQPHGLLVLFPHTASKSGMGSYGELITLMKSTTVRMLTYLALPVGRSSAQ